MDEKRVAARYTVLGLIDQVFGSARQQKKKSQGCLEKLFLDM